MSALIKKYEDMTPFEEHVLLTAIAHEWNEVGREASNRAQDNNGNFVVSFMVNGVEIDVPRFISRMAESHQRSVDAVAKELVEDKIRAIGQFTDPLYDFVKDFETKVREQFDVPKDSWDE